MVLLVLISFVVFSLLYLAPGSPEQLLLGARPSTPETIAAIRAQYHLERLVLRASTWTGRAAPSRFDFGRSIRTNEPVVDVLRQRLVLTLQLGFFAFLLTILVGIPLGISRPP